jgi:Cft2 family RNA processing exonuclease
MESTWGDPRFRLPPRKETIEKMLSLVADAFADRRTPVIHAYVLGKAQEITKCLTQAGIPVLQHPLIYEVSRIYRDRGCDLGAFGLYTGTPHAGHAVIVPPRMQKGFHVGGLTRTLTIAVTGWANDEIASRRWGTDYVLPLSDHSDFEQLLETVRLVAPERIYCTHGPESFVNELIERGYRAFVLGKTPQLTLF